MALTDVYTPPRKAQKVRGAEQHLKFKKNLPKKLRAPKAAVANSEHYTSTRSRAPSAGSRPDDMFANAAVGFSEAARGITSVQISMLPASSWMRPSVFPNLRDSEVVFIDTETWDPELRLRGKGPGFIREAAHVIGVSICARSRSGELFKGYYPIRHLADTQSNFEPDRVFQWLKDELNSDVPKGGANLLYDLEGLRVDGGVTITGPLWDIQNAEGIIDEESALVTSLSHRGFALGKLGLKYCGVSKDESELDKIQTLLGIKSIKAGLRDFPASVCGPYAERDAELSMEVWDKQKGEIERQGLSAVWQLECDIVPYLLQMRVNGVRVDANRAEDVSKALGVERSRMLDELRESAGFAVDPDSNDDLSRLCEQTHVQPLLTGTGRNSFTANWLKEQEHPAFKKVNECRRIHKVDRDFVRGVIMGSNYKGRIHSQFHQLKRSKDSGEADSQEDGTRSGRFSSTNPNLQQIPIRDKVLGPLIRSLFIPEDGGEWFCGDYSGQEPRLLSHYAARAARAGMLTEKAAKAAEDLLQAYIKDPRLDYHQKVADMTGLERDTAKPLNLMLVYGAGMKKVALTTGWITRQQYYEKDFKLPDNVTGFFASYHEGVPFVKELLKASDNLGQRRGYVTTYLGRRRHFDTWIPKTKEKGDFRATEPLPLALAQAQWPDEVLIRADTRKALNAVIQGSAADMGKVALRELGRAGLLPQILVHDEFNRSITGGREEAQKIWHVMKHAVPLLLPVLVDAGVGANWSEAKMKEHKIDFEEQEC